MAKNRRGWRRAFRLVRRAEERLQTALAYGGIDNPRPTAASQMQRALLALPERPMGARSAACLLEQLDSLIERPGLDPEVVATATQVDAAIRKAHQFPPRRARTVVAEPEEV